MVVSAATCRILTNAQQRRTVLDDGHGLVLSIIARDPLTGLRDAEKALWTIWGVWWPARGHIVWLRIIGSRCRRPNSCSHRYSSRSAVSGSTINTTIDSRRTANGDVACRAANRGAAHRATYCGAAHRATYCGAPTAIDTAAAAPGERVRH
jgi:hypothetical protein